MANIEILKGGIFKIKSPIENTKKLPYYGWYRDGEDYILNMGTMTKAVVIRRMWRDSTYFISEGSFFPFPVGIYQNRYNNAEDAVVESTKYMREWLGSTLEALTFETENNDG